MSSNKEPLLSHAKAVKRISSELTYRSSLSISSSDYRMPISKLNDCQNLIGQLIQAAKSHAFFLEQSNQIKANEQREIYNQIYNAWLRYQQQNTAVEAKVADGMVERAKFQIEQEEAQQASAGWFSRLLYSLFGSKDHDI